MTFTIFKLKEELSYQAPCLQTHQYNNQIFEGLSEPRESFPISGSKTGIS